MLGAIRGMDVCCHPIAVVRGFGWRVLYRCIVAVALGKRCTFLSMVGR